MQLFDSFAVHTWQELPSPQGLLMLPSAGVKRGLCCRQQLPVLQGFHNLFLSSILPVLGKFWTMCFVCNWNKTTCKILEKSSELVHIIFSCQLWWLKYCLSCCSLSSHKALPFFHVAWPKWFFQSCSLTSLFSFPANACPFFCLCHTTQVYTCCFLWKMSLG